jgi:hypothetical protein
MAADLYHRGTILTSRQNRNHVLCATEVRWCEDGLEGDTVRECTVRSPHLPHFRERTNLLLQGRAQPERSSLDVSAPVVRSRSARL